MVNSSTPWLRAMYAFEEYLHRDVSTSPAPVTSTVSVLDKAAPKDACVFDFGTRRRMGVILDASISFRFFNGDKETVDVRRPLGGFSMLSAIFTFPGNKQSSRLLGLQKAVASLC